MAVASTNDQVTVSVNAYGSAANSTYEFNDSTYLTKTIPLPANGATTVVIFSGSI